MFLQITPSEMLKEIQMRSIQTRFAFWYCHYFTYITITRQLKSAGETLGIRLLDHIIFSHKGYYSFQKKEYNDLLFFKNQFVCQVPSWIVDNIFNCGKGNIHWPGRPRRAGAAPCTGRYGTCSVRRPRTPAGPSILSRGCRSWKCSFAAGRRRQ